MGVFTTYCPLCGLPLTLIHWDAVDLIDGIDEDVKKYIVYVFGVMASISKWTKNVGIIDKNGKYRHLKGYVYSEYGSFVKGKKEIPINPFISNEEEENALGVHDDCCRVAKSAKIDLKRVFDGVRKSKINVTGPMGVSRNPAIYKVGKFNLLTLQEQDWNMIAFGENNVPSYVVSNPSKSELNSKRVIKIAKWLCRKS